MRWQIALVLIAALNSTAHAETQVPWFGSAASAPEQVRFARSTEQLIDSAEISAAKITIACPIEGCPLDAKLVKQPE